MATRRAYTLDWGLMLADAFLVAAAFWLAYAARRHALEPLLLPVGWMNKVYLSKDFLVLILYPPLLVASLVLASFYNPHQVRRFGLAGRAVLLATALAAIGFMGLVYIFSHENLVSRLQILLTALIADALILARWGLLAGRARRQREREGPEEALQSVVIPFPVVIPVDLILMAAAFWAAHFARLLLEPWMAPRGWMLRSWLSQYLPLLPLYPLLMLLALGVNSFFSYEPDRTFRRAARLLLLSTLEATVLLMALIYLFSHDYLVTRWQIALMALFMNLFLAARWLLVQRFLARLRAKSPAVSAPLPGGAPFPRVGLGGLHVHCCTMRQALDWLCLRVERREPAFVITPNLDHLYRYSRFPELRPFYAKADLALADGVPIYWLSQFAGCALPEKISGSDLFLEMSAAAAERGFGIYLLGGAPGVGDKAAESLQERFPGLRVRGIDAPPYLFETNPALWQETIGRLREARPDVVFVALGGDRQKRFIARAMEEIPGAAVWIEVGASIDFVAGVQKRAPRLLQQIGLEWLWRLALSPRRLFRRYIVDDLPFFFVLVWRVFRGKEN